MIERAKSKKEGEIEKLFLNAVALFVLAGKEEAPFIVEPTGDPQAVRRGRVWFRTPLDVHDQTPPQFRNIKTDLDK